VRAVGGIDTILGTRSVPALERSRLSHVFQNYVRPEALAAANALSQFP
jgi:hypothetical protein